MVKEKKLKELLIYSSGRFGELGITDFVSAFEEGISTFTFWGEAILSSFEI